MSHDKNRLIIPDEVLMNKIYLVRGEKVMIDNDLAELYEVETRRLNEQVQRNIDRFPEDFMFQLTQEEFSNLKSQIATSSWGGRRKLPYAFTEHGVLMLSGVLNSDRAIIPKTCSESSFHNLLIFFFANGLSMRIFTW
jgi:hypothetical protein